MAHHEDDALPRRELADLAGEHLPQLSRVRAPFGARCLLGYLVHPVFTFPPAYGRADQGSTTLVIDAGVHHDPVQPRAQLGVVAEAVERPVHFDEPFRRDALGVLVMAGELIRDAVHHRSMLLDETLERRRIAR